MATILTGHGITMIQLLSIKGQLALESQGLKSRGRTMYARVKERYGFKGNRQAVYNQLCQLIDLEAQKLQPSDIDNS